MNVTAAPTARGLGVAATATAAAAGTAALAVAAAPDPHAAAASFPDLLTLLAAVALTGCAVWGWLAVVAVLLEAATGRVGRVRGVPVVLRRLVLVLCGLTALAALAPPATAGEPRPDDGPTLTGLPFPDRAAGPAAPGPRTTPPPARPPAGYTVRPGDSLWSIARAARPRGSETAIARDVVRLHTANRSVIGADPDLIRPGQRLVAPRPSR